MRAIVQEGYGSADVLKLRELERPAVADDGILVRIRAASVNALDSHLVHAPLPLRLFFGLRQPKHPVRGVDLAGVVESVGKTVTRFRPGDQVFGCARGTFAEYASTTAERLAAMPHGLSFQQAAAIPVAGVTALQGLRDKAQVQPGQRVLIHGAGGGVGSFAVLVAKALGAQVTAVTSPRNLELVRSLGPDQLLDYTREDFVKRGERFDVLFDIAATRSLADCLKVLVPKGVLVLAGAPKGGWMAILRHFMAALVRSRFASQKIVMLMARIRHEDLAALGLLIESGKLVPAIDRQYALREVPDAIRYVKAGQGRAKVVINID